MHGNSSKTSQLKECARLYGEAAGRLNLFFKRYTARSCAECLDIHKRSCPGDPISRHELVAGIFPGCCQEGVADDMRIPGSGGNRLPEELVGEIIKRRPARNPAVSASYRVLDTRTGKEQEGRGCVWLGEGGCVLGEWKSPICLTYICEPVREGLSITAGKARWPFEEDFCGFGEVLQALSVAACGRDEDLQTAANKVYKLNEILELREKELSNGGGENLA